MALAANKEPAAAEEALPGNLGEQELAAARALREPEEAKVEEPRALVEPLAQQGEPALMEVLARQGELVLEGKPAPQEFPAPQARLVQGGQLVDQEPPRVQLAL